MSTTTQANAKSIPSFTIEKGVPLPQNSYGTRNKYPFAKMQVGDSFIVPVEPQTQISYIRAYNRVSSALSTFCKGPYAGQFTVRKCKDECGVRIWRLS